MSNSEAAPARRAGGTIASKAAKHWKLGLESTPASSLFIDLNFNIAGSGVQTLIRNRGRMSTLPRPTPLVVQPGSMGMIRILIRGLLLCAAAGGCVSGLEAPRDVERLRAINDQSAPAAGTYRVLFCARGCEGKDSLSATVSGVIVLSDKLIDSAIVDRLVAAGDFNAPEVDRGNSPNACFHLHHLDDRANGSFVSRNSTGIFAWTRPRTSEPGSARLLVFVDAEYRIDFAVTRSGIVGIGQWLPHIDGVPSHPYSVVGKRVGPPDAAFCASTGRAEDPPPNR